MFNRHVGRDVPLNDRNLREALNLAIDREKIISEGMLGYASKLAALTPPWCAGHPTGLQPFPHDPAAAKERFSRVAWPAGRALHIATGNGFCGIAEIIAANIRRALNIDVTIDIIADETALAGARALAESKLVPQWDILLNFWFDISSEATPAMIHREFFGSDGAFRVGPPLDDFDRLYDDMACQTEPAQLVAKAEAIDRHTKEEALTLFLCTPQSLTAVNNHVRFTPYATTFELAEAEALPGHWSIPS